MNEDRAEKVRVAAERLATAEQTLFRSRKLYNAALRAWEATAQVQLDTESKP